LGFPPLAHSTPHNGEAQTAREGKTHAQVRA